MKSCKLLMAAFVHVCASAGPSNLAANGPGFLAAQPALWLPQPFCWASRAASPPAVPAALLALLRHMVSCTRALILVKLHLSAGVLPAGVSSWFVPVLRRGHWWCERSGRWGAPSATSVCSLAGRHQSCRAAFGWALLTATGPSTELSDLRWQSEGAGGSWQPPEEQTQS